MRALLAAILLALTSGCVSTPLATETSHDPSDAVAASAADSSALDASAVDDGGLLLADSGSSSSAFRIWRDHDAYYELFANGERVQLNLALAPSAYAMFELDGPGDCADTDLGTGAAAADPSLTAKAIDCGVLPLGWYRVHLSVEGGLARGTLSSTGGHLRALEFEE